MKKVISTIAALALAAVMATSAFAATTVTKEDLKNWVSKASVPSSVVDASSVKSVANQVIDALTDEQVANLSKESLQSDFAVATEKVEKAGNDKAALVTVASDLNAMVEKRLEALGATVEMPTWAVEVYLNEFALKPTSNLVVNGQEISVPEVRGEVKASAANNGSTTTTATSGAAASTAGVIKATGLNTTGAAVVALAVASVLGAAAVKARKLGE